MKSLIVIALVAVGSLTGVACRGDSAEGDATAVINPGDSDNYQPDITAADFVAVIDNPYLPLMPGSRWVYESDEGAERIEVTVLPETRQVMGIAATVVRDTVTEDGELVEDTYDWYAQDREGNVWYLGEDTTEFEDGEPVSTDGSWEAGVDGARPGIIMLADPQIGAVYRQEYYPGEAEDMAEVRDLAASETTPYGRFPNLLVIREWTPLEPDVVEEKYYAPAIGPVLEVKVAGESGRMELVSYEPGK